MKAKYIDLHLEMLVPLECKRDPLTKKDQLKYLQIKAKAQIEKNCFLQKYILSPQTKNF